jgi:predicted DCC family thiol-disulfide oxidoreductase YuxK
VLVIYDDDCAFCSRSIRYAARHDAARRLRFAGRDSAAARAAVPVRPGRSTILVVTDAGVLTESDAVFAICGVLDGPARYVARLRVVPRPLRDGAYRVVARVRHRLGRRMRACPLDDAVRERLA